MKKGVSLKGADLSGNDLREADLSEADLRMKCISFGAKRKRFQKLMDPGPGFWPGKDLFWGDNSYNREKQAIAYLWERTFGYMDIPGIKEFFIIEND